MLLSYSLLFPTEEQMLTQSLAYVHHGSISKREKWNESISSLDLSVPSRQITSTILIWGIPIHDEDDEIMQLWIRGQGPKPKGPTALGECKFTAARWPRFSTWMLDYHSHPGVMSRTWKSKAKFHDDFTKVLKKTGEKDGWWMHHFVVEYFCFL